MNKRKTVCGICPLSNKKSEITVKYVESSTMEGEEYSKGTFDCDNRIALNCKPNTCPIYKNAPEKII